MGESRDGNFIFIILYYPTIGGEYKIADSYIRPSICQDKCQFVNS